MSASVKLSLKAALEIINSLEDGPSPEVVREISAAIAKSQRSSATRRKLAKPKAEKRATKREETSAIRVVVFARASHCCEACGAGFLITWPGELDHQRGRGKAPQTVENCWALCRTCHWQKTNNHPDSAHWLKAFISHCVRRGYMAEARRAQSQLSWVESKAVKP